MVTAAGVSSGIDMGLRLAQRIAGDDMAQAIQLGIEYDPEPPFDAGSPEKAPPHLVEALRGVLEQAEAERGQPRRAPAKLTAPWPRYVTHAGAGPPFGHSRSHSMVATKRRFNPNLQKVRIDDRGTARRVYVCTRCLKAGKVTKPGSAGSSLQATLRYGFAL